MYLPPNQRQPQSSSSHKASTASSILQARYVQKLTAHHFSQYTSTSQTQKNGLIPAVSFTSQQSVMHASQEHFPFNIKHHQSVYEQYLKSLETQINSREKQRIQLQRSLDELNHQYALLFEDFKQEKTTNQQLKIKLEQIETTAKETEDKKKLITNQKETLTKQHQNQMQKNSILQTNEIKLRLSYQTLSKTYETLQQQHQILKSQSNASSFKVNQTINKIREEQNGKNKEIQQLESQVKSLEALSKGYKEQVQETVMEKNRMIEMVMREKGFVERELQKEQKERLEVKSLLGQKEEQVKQLGKKMTELEQCHELEKDRLNYRINEISFEKAALVKQIELAKLQLKSELQQAVVESMRLKMVLGQIEKQKKVQSVHSEELHKGLDRLQKEISGLVESKLSGEKEKQAIKVRYEKELQVVKGRCEEWERVNGEKCVMYEKVQGRLQMVEREFERYKRQAVGQVLVLEKEVDGLKEQFASEQALSIERISILTRQKDTLVQKTNAIQMFHSRQLKSKLQQASREAEAELAQVRNHYQTQVQFLTSSSHDLNSQMSLLTHQMLEQKQLHLAELKKLSLDYDNKLSRITQLQSCSSQQIESHYNEQLAHQSLTVKRLNQNVYQHQATIAALKQQLDQSLSASDLSLSLQQSLEAYAQVEAKLKAQINDLNGQITAKNQFIFQLQTKSTALQSSFQHQSNALAQSSSKAIASLNQLEHAIKLTANQIAHTSQSQHSAFSSQTTESSPIQILSSLKHRFIALFQQQASLQAQINQPAQTNSTHRFNSSLQTQRQLSLRSFQQQVKQLAYQLQQQLFQTQLLSTALSQTLGQIVSVIEFAQKYSGESISKTPHSGSKTSHSEYFLNVDDQTLKADEQQHRQMHVKKSQSRQLAQIARSNCESLSTFIGERLYVISILMQENTQLKQNAQKAEAQIQIFSEQLRQQQSNCQNIYLSHKSAVEQISSLKQQLQMSKKQTTQSITSLKKHIDLYKSQLSRYQTQISHISHKFQQHQLKFNTLALQKLQLQKQILQLKNQLNINASDFESQCKLIFKLTNQVQALNSQLSQKNLYLKTAKDQAQKIAHQHILDLQQLKMTHFSQLHSAQQHFLAQKKTLKLSTQIALTKHRQQSLACQQKISHLQKLLHAKNLQSAQLQTHFAQTLKTHQTSHLTQLSSLQNQIKFLQNKSHSPSKSILTNKLNLLQNHAQNLQKQLRILSDSNTLLRKNYLSALAQKQALRQEAKLNKSQRTDSIKSSHEIPKSASQDLKNKYLLRKNTERKKSGQLQSILSQSLGPRSSSNSNLHTSQSKRFESPRDSSTKMSSQNMNLGNSTVEAHPDTERPISSIQKTSPQIPLDLKRIRQRNQKYFVSQGNDQLKEIPSSISSKKQDLKPKLLNEDELPLLVSPIKQLQPNQSY